MVLSGSVLKQIHAALCKYLTVEELKHIFRFNLDLDLNAEVFGTNYKDLIFDVICFAERRGLGRKLALAAIELNNHPALKTALEPWLNELPPDAAPLQPAFWEDLVPVWALGKNTKVEIVRCLRRGRVSPNDVPTELRREFANSLDKNDTDNLVRDANAIRCAADPDFDEHAIALSDFGDWYFHGKLGYWNLAFDRACSRGGRLLGSLLLSTPPDLYEANKEIIVSIIKQLRDGHP